MNSDEVGQSRSPGKQDTLLRERFSNAIAEQSSLMDNLAKSLLTVELAIPGFYASILKLVGCKESLALAWPVGIAFGCWLIALAATLYAVLPKAYEVDPEQIRNSPTSIESFFYHSARHKWRFLLVSIVFFIAGIGALFWDAMP
ncbi:MAG: hypothetical protein ACRER2_12670 [Methylococcales bacterium]